MSTSNFRVVRFERARELLDALDLSRPEWSGEGAGARWIFRGQADSRWRLQPTAWRPEQARVDAPLGRLRAQLEAFEGPPPPPDTIQRRFHEIWMQVSTEIAVASAFASLADDLGIPVPDHDRLPSKFDVHDPHWRAELQEAARPHTTSDGRATRPRPFAANSAFALAQHHGIPTRLLDCTRDPAVAAYFAAERAPREGDGCLSVWAIDSVVARESGELTVVRVPRSHISYLHAQSGLFLLHAHAETFFEADGEWPDVLEALERAGADSVRRFDLPLSEGAELRRILWRRRVSLAHMMPTYDSVTTTLQQQWELFGG
jgi:hypothetical protein